MENCYYMHFKPRSGMKNTENFKRRLFSRADHASYVNGDHVNEISWAMKSSKKSL